MDPLSSLARRALDASLTQLRAGRLVLLDEGRERSFGEASAETVTVRVLDRRARQH